MDRITSRTQSGEAIVPIKRQKGPQNGPLKNPYEAAVQRLADYEDTGLSPEQVLEMQGEMVTFYDPDGIPYLVEATGLQAKRIIDRDIAESQGRIWEAPCKMGTTLYMIVTKRPKLNWPEFSFVKTSYLTENNFFRVIRDFGKTVFLTKEEADAALEKVKEEQP